MATAANFVKQDFHFGEVIEGVGLRTDYLYHVTAEYGEGYVRISTCKGDAGRPDSTIVFESDGNGSLHASSLLSPLRFSDSIDVNEVIEEMVADYNLRVASMEFDNALKF